MRVRLAPLFSLRRINKITINIILSFADIIYMKLKYFITTAAVVLVAALGSLFSQFGMSWYDGLIKPTQWIPSFIIPIV